MEERRSSNPARRPSVLEDRSRTVHWRQQVPFSQKQRDILQTLSWACSYVHVEVWDMDQIESSYRSSSDFADLVLVLAKGQIPTVSSTVSGGLRFGPPLSGGYGLPGSQYDAQAWLLMKSYHHVALPASMKAEQEDNNWYIALYNWNVWTQVSLKNYIIKASCTTQAPCPAPLPFQPPCTEHGTCKQGDRSSHCLCKTGWGNVGCSVKLKVLQATAPHREIDLDVRHWTHFEFQVPNDVRGFFVELLRLSGDPILFTTAALDLEGAQAELPSVMDYPSHADSESLEEMSNKHFITRRTHSFRRFYISVYNNPGRITEPASFMIKAGLIHKPASCPFKCSLQGNCVATINSHAVECVCKTGFAGRLCETPISAIESGKKQSGVLLPGRSVFYEWNLTLEDLMELPSMIEVHVKIESDRDVHPVLCAELNGLPSVKHSTYHFLMKYGPAGNSVHKIRTGALRDGNLTFGLFNIDLFVHSSFKYSLTIEARSSYPSSITVFSTVVLGATAAFLVGVVMLGMRLILMKLRERRNSPHPQGQSTERSGSAVHLLSSMERSVFSAHNQCEMTLSIDAEAPSCSICICEYTDGDSLVTLPCNHAFHENCITQWFERDGSCPICRHCTFPEPSQD